MVVVAATDADDDTGAVGVVGVGGGVPVMAAAVVVVLGLLGEYQRWSPTFVYDFQTTTARYKAHPFQPLWLASFGTD